MYDFDDSPPPEPAWLEKCRTANRRDLEKYYATMAEPAFKNHKITLESPGQYLCQEPGTIIYGFRVVFLPRATLLYGDIGHCLIEPYDTVGWLKGSVRSPQYVFEKMGVRRTQFEEGLAMRAIAEEWDSGYYDRAQKMWDEWGSSYYHDENEWVEMVSRFDTEMIELAYDYPSQSYWHLEALRWFCINIEAQDSNEFDRSTGRPVSEATPTSSNESV